MNNFINKIVNKIIKIFYREVVLEIAYLSLENDLNYTSGESCKIRMIEKKDFPALAERFGTFKIEKFTQWINNSYGYMIINQGKIAGYCWASPNLSYKEGIEPFVFDVNPKKGNIYLFDAYIHPDSRRTQVISIFAPYLINDLKERGYKKCFYFYNKNNVLMKEHVTPMLGFKSNEKIVYRRFFVFIVKDMKALSRYCVSED
ncbi:MAG: GNAT family N-acetyltransferase [Proteobacteria bacterium]|nr:GNAT family N-acetyltransferase [Pseudomonadota bacterium]